MVKYAVEEEDFDWIYKSGTKEDLLGMFLPFPLRENIRNHEVIITDDKLAFCDFHYAKKFDHVSIYHICTLPEGRGKGKAKELIEFLHKQYSCPVQAVCISGTASEDFWSKVAVKIGDKTSKTGTKLSIYRYGQPNKHLEKEILF